MKSDWGSRLGGPRASAFSIGSKVRVHFSGFWPGFDPYAFFVPMLETAPFHFDVSVVTKNKADIEFHSVFEGRLRRMHLRLRRRLHRLATGKTLSLQRSNSTSHRKPVRIWFTGENVRPTFTNWDLTLSFDPDSQVAKNVYFPLWWQLFPELVGQPEMSRSGIVERSRRLPLSSFLSSRKGQAGDRKRFACAIISNAEPTRMRAITALQKLGAVDVYGQVTGHPVVDKFEVLSDYQFTICFENSLYPGYVTEKLFDAWSAGSIPLWWGMDRGGYLNQNAVVNLASNENLDSFIDSVASLRSSASVMNEVSSQPLLLRRPSLEKLHQDLMNVFFKQ